MPKLNVDDLKKLYKVVKNHKFRVNNNKKYLREYENALYEMTQEFYIHLSDAGFDVYDTMFGHNWNCIIGTLYNNTKYLIESEIIVGMVHKFLDGKDFQKRMPTWSEKKQRYVIVNVKG